MIYWRGINIGDWWFYAEIAKIKSTFLFQSEHAQWHVAQNPPINFPQTNSSNITLANKSPCTNIVYQSFSRYSKCFKFQALSKNIEQPLFQ